MAWFRRTKKPAEPRCGAVVVAAGSSTRMGEDKILIPLEEEPVIVHTVRALELAPQITEIVVVTRQDLIVPVAQLCQDYGFEKVRKVVAGGASRLHSVRIGTLELSRGLELIAIHDGARPFVPQDVIEQVIRKAGECGAAAPAVPINDTVKEVREGLVERTVDRTMLRAVQTPQVFDAGLIRAALQKALDDGAEVTDDCSVVERLGMRVALTPGDPFNLKLTTPEDLILARGILEGRSTAL